jgi:hypothetical protein
MKTKNNYQFEFSLFINDKIICQRFFNDYNYKKKEIDFDVAVDIITVTTNLIKDFLKAESIEILWKNYDSFNPKKIFNKEPKNHLFKITIGYKSKVIASSCIEGHGYPPKGRYNVDIRPIIPIIISNIRFNLK